MKVEWKATIACAVGYMLLSIAFDTRLLQSPSLFVLLVLGCCVIALLGVYVPVVAAKAYYRRQGCTGIGAAWFAAVLSYCETILFGTLMRNSFQFGAIFLLGVCLAAISLFATRSAIKKIASAQSDDPPLSEPQPESDAIKTEPDPPAPSLAEEPALPPQPAPQAVLEVVADTPPQPHTPKWALYSLGVLCLALMITTGIFASRCKKLNEEINAHLGAEAVLQTKAAALEVENFTLNENLIKAQHIIFQQEDKLVEVSRVVCFYYENAGILDGEGKTYYHRFGCGCPILNSQDSAYIFNIENMPRRSKACPHCYSSDTYFPIDGVSTKY